MAAVLKNNEPRSPNAPRQFFTTAYRRLRIVAAHNDQRRDANLAQATAVVQPLSEDRARPDIAHRRGALPITLLNFHTRHQALVGIRSVAEQLQHLFMQRQVASQAPTQAKAPR